MISASEINLFWKDLEEKSPPPKYVIDVQEINFDYLKKQIDEHNQDYIYNLIKKMHSGVAFIIRNAANKSLKETIIALAKEYDQKQPPSFHKMIDGSPNFHRIIDKDITKNYSLYAIKHSYYFYNWNIKSELEKIFKEEVYRHWRYIKFLAGNPKNCYENNIPSQNQIDRLQIVNYPLGGGELRDHEDPRKNQRIVSGIIMSKIGEDFESGGFYFRGEGNKKLNLETQLEVGDSVMFYGSIIHGVEVVDPDKNLDWSSYNGRWFVGMFVNDSDCMPNRVTAKDLTGSTNFN